MIDYKNGPLNWYFLLIKYWFQKNSHFPLILHHMVLWLNVWNKEILTLRNFVVVTKKFLKAKFDCTMFFLPNKLYRREALRLRIFFTKDDFICYQRKLCKTKLFHQFYIYSTHYFWFLAQYKTTFSLKVQILWEGQKIWKKSQTFFFEIT